MSATGAARVPAEGSGAQGSVTRPPACARMAPTAAAVTSLMASHHIRWKRINERLMRVGWTASHARPRDHRWIVD
jgi:hypothetical protein